MQQSQTEQEYNLDFYTRFKYLQTGFQSVSKLVNELKRLDGGGYNIFKVLGVDRKEVKTHSAFLADLLDPRGSHCQGHLFLRSFLELFCNGKRAVFDHPVTELVKEPWLVDQEKHTQFGNLDIVLSCPALGGYLIVIENKIDAGEQENQLNRYAQWLESQQGLFTRRILCYLTPDGKEPSSSSGRNYEKMSYHTDVYHWLTHSSSNIYPQRVREVLTQYIDLIKTI